MPILSPGMSNRTISTRRTDIASAISLVVYASTVVITPLSLLNMADELSFSLAGGGALEAGRALLLLAALVLSGKAAGRLGKTRTVGAGLFVMALALFGAGMAVSYWGIMGMLLIIGFGSGFAEALINPLIHDTHPENSGRYLNIINAFFSLGVVAGVLLSGFLLSAGVSWRSLFTGLGLITLLPAVMFAAAPKIQGETGKETALRDWGACLRQPAFWVLAAAIFFGGASEAAFTFWSASYIRIHFQAQPSAAGIGTAFFAGAMVIGRLLAGRLARGASHDRRIMGFLSAAGLVIGIIAWSAGSLPVFALSLFAAGLVVAPYWPTIQSISPAYVAADPTLLFILLSIAGIPGFGSATWIMGLIGDRRGLQSAFLVIPVCFLILTLLFALLGRFRTTQRPKPQQAPSRQPLP